MYSIFTYDVLNNLHLGLFGALKESLTRYLHSDFAYSYPHGAKHLRNRVRTLGRAIMLASELLAGSHKGR